MRNTWGILFTLTTFGESHGEAIGGIIDGMPSGVEVDLPFIQRQLLRRRPGQSSLATARQEADEVKLLSGVFEGKTLGTPIAFRVNNTDARPADYESLRHLYRPSHADYTYQQKYGLRDPRGGGRSSARITLSRVVGGAFAQLALRRYGISVSAFTSQVGDIQMPLDLAHTLPDLSEVEQNPVRCPDSVLAEKMAQLISRVRAVGDTVGGVVTGLIRGCPPGLGEPEFSKLQATLAAAMLSINAAKGFDYGSGFDGLPYLGSQLNDPFVADDAGHIYPLTNHSGGIQGGISNGADIYFRVAFKPAPTLLRDQPTVNDSGHPAIVHAKGRHDPCVVPRAVPIVEAMAAMVVLDQLLVWLSQHGLEIVAVR